MRRGIRWVVMAFAVIVWCSTDGLAQIDRPHPDTLAMAVQAIENLDILRSG